MPSLAQQPTLRTAPSASRYVLPLSCTRVASGVALRATDSSTASTSAPTSNPTSLIGDDGRQKWWLKPNGFHDLKDSSRLLTAVESGSHLQKWTIVEFYASWCGTCRSSFPGLCRLPENETLKSTFQFFKASLDDRGIHRYVRKSGIEGIPVVCVYNPRGEMVLRLNANFSNLPKVKASLKAIAENPHCDNFVLGPNGIATPVEEGSGIEIPEGGPPVHAMSVEKGPHGISMLVDDLHGISTPAEGSSAVEHTARSHLMEAHVEDGSATLVEEEYAAGHLVSHHLMETTAGKFRIPIKCSA